MKWIERQDGLYCVFIIFVALRDNYKPKKDGLGGCVVVGRHSTKVLLF